MGYLNEERARTRRADPKQILPGCQSILALGLRYSNPELENHKRKIKIMEIVIFMFLVMLFMVTIIIIWTK